MAPGSYRGYFEKQGSGLAFASMPHGIHAVEPEACAAFGNSPLDTAYDVRIACVSGATLLRTDGGKYCAADAVTKERITEAYADVMGCLTRCAELRLKFASPIIVEIKDKSGALLYEYKRPAE